MKQKVIEEMTQRKFKEAYRGSWYTIFGTGGDLQEWVAGYERELAEQNIGTPKQWYRTTGAQINQFLKPTEDRDWLPADLTVLMFPLDGLSSKLPIFKIVMQDRWFDDFVDNTRSATVRL